MNKEEFINKLKELDITFTEDNLKQLEIYKNELKEYNTHTNLTAITNDEDIYLKHFYDSLTIVKAINLNNINNLLDVGTGAGFPGMVIKIFYPNIKVTLLDSNNKKIKFLEELSTKLNIDVELIHSRVEDYAKENLNKYDLVTSRAVASLRVLSEISLPLVKKDGLFIPLKGNLDNELEDALKTLECLNAHIERKITFNLNDASGIRNILVIRKLKETKKDQLRSYNQILKKPLKNYSK